MMGPRLSIAGRTALVTGAGSGIGRATALELGRQGGRLIICDINAEQLAATAADLERAGQLELQSVVDVSSADAMEAFAREVHARIDAVDILVNNAGVAVVGGVLHTTKADWEWLLSVNLWGVIHGCRLFVPPLVAACRGGHVVNVSSAAGFHAHVLLAAYSTTKFAVLGLSEALRDELRPHRIGVSTICPGVIDTPIIDKARIRGPYAESGFRDRVHDLYRKRAYGPERVALAIVDAIRRNRAVVPVTPEAWAIYLLKRASPRLSAAVGRAMNQFMSG